MPDPESSYKGQVSALWITGRGQAELRYAPEPQLNAGEGTDSDACGRASAAEPSGWSITAPSRPPSMSAWRGPLRKAPFRFPSSTAIALSASWRRAPAISWARRCSACIRTRTRFVAPMPMLALVPDGVPARRAVLAANMETALNALWDSGCGPADRIVVVGGGVVGLLVAHLAARLPGAEVTLVDVEAERAPRRGAGRALRIARRCAQGGRLSSSTPAPPRPGSIWRCPAPASRRRSSK